MAYADKITNMRRMAIIYKNHNIVWEGVNIEGTCILKEVNTTDNTIKIIEEASLLDWIDAENFLNTIKLEIKYQDKKEDSEWEPRKTDC